MGFLDKAKNSFADRFGDEVVRKGAFATDQDNEIEEQKDSREPTSKSIPTSRRKARQKLPRESKPKIAPQPEPDEFQDDPFFEDEPSRVEQQYESESYDYATVDTPRSIDPGEFEKLAKSEGQSVEEVLKSMRISETFTIDDGILFLDEELANQSFATQAPYGYDMGEVDFFLAKSQRSVAEYVKLLRVRNDDVVRLATRISDMMVDLNNIRFTSEVANGINIMASGGDDDGLAVDLQEARSRAQRLQEDLDRIRSSGSTSKQEDLFHEMEGLRNSLAAERISRLSAEAEAQDLRAHLVLIEEEYDIQVFSDQGEIQSSDSSGYESYEEQRSDHFQQSSDSSRPEEELYAEESGYQKIGRDHWLPGLEETGLPSVPDEQELPDGGFEFEEAGLENISLDSFDESDSGFEQSDGNFQNSAFTADPYQNLDEFIETNLDGFPDDNRSSSIDTVDDDEDPDEDGFAYSFERRI